MFCRLLIALMAATCQACPSEFTQHRDHCYEFINGVVSSWLDAYDYCKMKGAFLTDVLVDDEHLFILKALQELENGKYSYFWVGHVQVAGGPWISAAEEVDNVVLLASAEICVAIRGADGGGYQFPCNNKDSQVHGWICKKRIK